MTARRIALGTLVAVLALAIAAGAWGWRAMQRRDAVLAALPPVPALSPAQQPLRTRLAAAGEQARSLGESVAGLAKISQLYHANGFLEEAMQCYAALEVLAPGEPRWLHRHAVILAGYGEVEPVLIRWRRVIELAPDYLPAQLRLADFELKANRVADASTRYQAILARHPDEPYALLGLARIDFEAGRWEPARQRLEKVVQATNYKLGYDLIVSVYERLGETVRAAAIRGQMKASGAYREPADPWMDELLDECFEPYRLAVAAGMASDSRVAEGLLRRAIALASEEVSYRMQLVSLYSAEQNWAAAIAELQQATQRTPTFADAWAQLSGLNTKIGNPAAAEQALLEGLRHCPDSPGLHLMRGTALHRAGQLDAAVRELTRSIELRPNEPEAYIELGHTQLDRGELDTALALLHRALEIEPENPAALTFLTFHAINTRDETAARYWMQRARAQPRLGEGPAQFLAKLYREKFGTEFVPEGRP